MLFLIWGRTPAKAQSIDWKAPNRWVDSILAAMTEDEKITQLMTVAVWTQRDASHEKEIEKLILDYKVGGLMFMKGGPIKQANLCNRFQSKSKIPLLISIDGEWGLNMRLDSTPVFPRQMVLGAANNLELTKQMGQEIAKHCKRIGIQLNFAPDVDINNNALNPVINDRSFGENKYTVAKHGLAYARGLQELRIMPTAKHFPGHGDTESDSHHSLPMINANTNRLDSLELYPFKELINNGVLGVMVGHLFVPSIDTTNNTASSISVKAVTELLKNKLGFEGLVVSDGLNMKGVANYAAPGEVCAKALAAGVDLLLFVEDVPQSLYWIKDYISRGLISKERLDEACRKILKTKYWCGLNRYEPIQTNQLVEDLNCCSTDMLIKKIVKNAVVVAKNVDGLIPLVHPELDKIAVVSVGYSGFSVFQQTLNNYLHADYFNIDKNDSVATFNELKAKLMRYSLVVLSLQNTSRFISKKLGITQQEIDFINQVMNEQKCVLVVHGNPYILKHFQGARNVILAFEDLPVYNSVSAQILVGAISASGKMPVSILPAFGLNVGTKTHLTERNELVMPEEIEIDHTPLQQIDSLISQAIRAGATPGCQIWASKNGKVFYQKSFGRHIYDTLSPEVQNHHLYDIASLTKIMSTTLAMMKLYEEGKIGLNDKLSLYLPFLRGSNKENLTIREVLLHEAGLIPFIPFYKQTIIDGQLDTNVYRFNKQAGFEKQVCDDLFIRNNYEETLFEAIAKSELKTPGNYVYSDLGFILLRKLVEVVAHDEFENFLQRNFYKPLNLANMVYNPLSKGLNPGWIVPTENDQYFRAQLINGYVHDPAAAMMGGVSGHAGLFANANDVGVVMQLLLNEGTYGGRRLLKATTIELFTKKSGKKSRRGLGFDKPETTNGKSSPAGNGASALCFGHTGFTGTCTWADPKNELVFVFLSNRVYPTAENKRLSEQNIRTSIHDILIEACKKKF